MKSGGMVVALVLIVLSSACVSTSQSSLREETAEWEFEPITTYDDAFQILANYEFFGQTPFYLRDSIPELVENLEDNGWVGVTLFAWELDDTNRNLYAILAESES